MTLVAISQELVWYLEDCFLLGKVAWKKIFVFVCHHCVTQLYTVSLLGFYFANPVILGVLAQLNCANTRVVGNINKPAFNIKPKTITPI